MTPKKTPEVSPGEACKHTIGQPAPHGITPLGECGRELEDKRWTDAGATMAALSGIELSFTIDEARPVDIETIAYFLHFYGLAMLHELDAPTRFRRWTESLSAPTMRQALLEASRLDVEFQESVSYHEGVRHPSLLTWARLGVRRATIRAFMTAPDSDLGVLHVQCIG